MKTKQLDAARHAIDEARERGYLHDGCTIHVGGFGLCGIPEHLIIALRDSGVKNLTCVSNNAGVDDWGLGLLLETRQIKKMVSSYVGENSIFEKQFIDGELEVEFNPQGTLAERIRAGGAGIPCFFTATGAGTPVAEGKETRELVLPAEARRAQRENDTPRARPFIMETGIFADLALVKADTADPFGNLLFRKTARNFNPMMAQAASWTIAEVDHTVGLGEIDADRVHTPGSYVDRFVKTESEKRIEQKTTRS